MLALEVWTGQPLGAMFQMSIWWYVRSSPSMGCGIRWLFRYLRSSPGGNGFSGRCFSEQRKYSVWLPVQAEESGGKWSRAKRELSDRSLRCSHCQGRKYSIRFPARAEELGSKSLHTKRELCDPSLHCSHCQGKVYSIRFPAHVEESVSKRSGAQRELGDPSLRCSHCRRGFTHGVRTQLSFGTMLGLSKVRLQFDSACRLSSQLLAACEGRSVMK